MSWQKSVAVLLCAFLVHCGSSQKGTSMSGEGVVLSQQQAQQIINDFREKNGIPRQPGASPTSMAEVLDILARDEVDRFGAASEFALGHTGVDALLVRANLELGWAEAQRMVATLFDDFGSRRKAELAQLEAQARRAAKSLTGDPRMDSLREQIVTYQKVRRALLVLADDHLESGFGLASEAMRLYPKKPGGMRAAANYYRMKRQWAEFDQMLRRTESLGEKNHVGTEYLRALERLERFTLKSDARKRLEEVQAKAPEFLRVQARLVLMQDDIEQTYSEMQRLQAVNPRHFIIAVAGATITEEYKTSRELRKANPIMRED